MNIHPTPSKQQKRPLLLLSRRAGRFLLTGQILTVLSLCHFAAMLGGDGRAEALLYIDAYADALSSALVLLWGTALGMDLWERSEQDHRHG